MGFMQLKLGRVFLGQAQGPSRSGSAQLD